MARDQDGGGVTLTPMPPPSGTASEGDASRTRDVNEWRRFNTQLRQALLVASSAEDIAQIQSALASAGLLTGRFQVGAWDPKSVDALMSLGRYANSTGMNFQDALQSYATVLNGGEAPGGANAQQQFVAQPTSAADIRLALKDASAQLVAGGGFDEATLNRLVEVYQAQEVEEQRAQFNAQVWGAEGGTGAAASQTSAETRLRQIVEAEDPAGVGAKGAANAYNEWLGALQSVARPSKL